MRLLISLCNRTDEAPDALILFEPRGRQLERVLMADPAHGALGLCLSSPSVVHAVFDLGRRHGEQTEQSEVRALNAHTLALLSVSTLIAGRDVHSITLDSGDLYAVSTGTDELLRLSLAPDGSVASERAVWRPEAGGDRTDRHHLNDVAVIGEQLLISGFGPRPRPMAWEDARHGFVLSVLDGGVVLGPVYHPHSICSLGGGEIAVCESPRRRIITSGGRVSPALPGYARGLCLTGRSLYVGTSRERHPSEAASILPSSPPAEDEGIASICELDVETLAIREIVELSPYGREVYDIVELPTPS